MFKGFAHVSSLSQIICSGTSDCFTSGDAFDSSRNRTLISVNLANKQNPTLVRLIVCKKLASYLEN